MESLRPSTPAAYRLLHEGSLAFAKIEEAGMRIDMDYFSRIRSEVTDSIREARNAIKSHKIYKVWQKQFGTDCNIQSKEQLGTVLFNVMGLECKQFTKSGRPSTNESHLSTLNEPFVNVYLQYCKLQKLYGTYIKSIEREICGGYLHPFFNSHLVWTYRSSCDTPNIQNVPIRNPTIAKLIRSAFIPRPGRVLVEIDYSQIEVRVAACYHKDPRMLEYIRDGHDFHSDLAKQIYMLDDNQVSKGARAAAKGLFVFAEFYGDYYIHVAKGLWEAIGKHGIKCGDISLYDHLKQKGIRELGALDPKQEPKKGTFEFHIKQIEKDFWEKRFPIYNSWRKKLWERYQDRGYIRTLTGFVVGGVHKRNEIINAPIQGSAFHCMLWSIPKVQRKFRKHKLKSLVIAQIHDSMLVDTVKSELKDVLQIAQEIMVEELCASWDWIITPLAIEAEASETNWYEKKAIAI